jgi:hypothetical protein
MRHPLHFIIVLCLPLSACKAGIVTGPFAFIAAGVLAVLCLKNDSDTRQRYPTYAIFSRFALAAIVLAVVPLQLIDLMMPYVFLDLWTCVFGGYMAAVLVCLIGMIFHGSIVFLFFRGTSEYYQAKSTGFRWFFDSIPGIFNPDSDATRHTGNAEPKVEHFKPPENWKYQCPVCGARVEHKIDCCWHCGYGRDGDSTVYYNKHGIQPPTPPEEKPNGPYVPITTED